MARTARKLNFMIRQDLADDLERLVPAGQRSKVVNDAIAKELELYRRRVQTERLLVLRGKSPALSVDELVKSVRRDRDRG